MIEGSRQDELGIPKDEQRLVAKFGDEADPTTQNFLTRLQAMDIPIVEYCSGDDNEVFFNPQYDLSRDTWQHPDKITDGSIPYLGIDFAMSAPLPGQGIFDRERLNQKSHENLRLQRKLLKVIDGFYRQRQVPIENRLVVTLDGNHQNAFIIHSMGAMISPFLDTQEMGRKIESYKKEMGDFANFMSAGGFSDTEIHTPEIAPEETPVSLTDPRTKESSEKSIMWKQKTREVKKIPGIEKRIIDTVTALWVHGFSTFQSCEGHVNPGLGGGSFAPYIEISHPKITTPGVTEKIDWQDINRYNLQQWKKIIDLLDEFYHGTSPDSEIMLFPAVRVQKDKIFGFRLACAGATSAELFNPNERAAMLKRYQQEMNGFTRFLREKYLYEN